MVRRNLPPRDLWFLKNSLKVSQSRTHVAIAKSSHWETAFEWPVCVVDPYPEIYEQCCQIIKLFLPPHLFLFEIKNIFKILIPDLTYNET